MNNNNNGNGNGDNGWNWWKIGAAAAGVGAAAAVVYKLSSQAQAQPRSQSTTESEEEDTSPLASFARALENTLNKPEPMEDIIPQSDVAVWPHIVNLNTLLSDIYNRYVAIKREDFQRHYTVFDHVFNALHKAMKSVDKYYGRFASDVKFSGSHFDGLRIKKPDEFDMDIVIGLPVSMKPGGSGEEDITIRQNFPGYVELVAGVQYQKLLVRDGADCQIYRAAYEWMDERKFILRSKFVSWFKSVGNRALNSFVRVNSLPAINVNGVWYTIRSSESGPAWTIIIESVGFRLDVDLVPALKFPETRWPVGKQYRSIPEGCRRDYWMVVPKPNKSGNTVQDEHRSWRLALQDQEKKLLYNTYALRKTICLVKKLRDSLGMKKIASYYIKTIFFWEIMELKSTDPMFWQRHDIGKLFTHMVKKFYEALQKGEIKYFWNPNLNLIANLGTSTLNEYKYKIRYFLEVLETPSHNNTPQFGPIAKMLLTSDEYMEYMKFLP